MRFFGVDFFVLVGVKMSFDLQFTDKEITAWGGMSLLKAMLTHIDWDLALGKADLPQPGSNRGYSPVQLINQFMLSIWCGANRFEHMEVTRFDPTLGRLFNFSRMANYKSFTRFLDKFNQEVSSDVFPVLYQHLFSQLKIKTLTLDLDSTVLTRYGAQEGAAVGYNPSKRGRKSHHPLMAFVAETKMIANVWLRPGNTASANNVVQFFDETCAQMGDKRVGLLRADSGFCDNEFLSYVENKKNHYTIAMKLTPPLQRQLYKAVWTPILSDKKATEVGIEWCDFYYQADAWTAPRRMVGIRQNIKIRENAHGKHLNLNLNLFPEDKDISQWRYGAIVSNLDLPALEIWRIYRGRADCENRIKELKYDFALGTLSRKGFWATEAALNFVMLSYNLMSLFRLVMQKQINKNGITQTLASLRHKLFAQAGYIINDGRKQILKLATAMQKRAWMKSLWETSQTFITPIPEPPKNLHILTL